MANLITLSDYKDAEGISGSQDDLQLTYLIGSVSQLVKTYCATSFVDYVAVDKEETFNVSFSTNALFLNETPVISITEVGIKDTPISTEVVLAPVEYVVDRHIDTIYRVNSGGRLVDWPIGPDAVRVAYRAGYQETPKDLRLAVIDLINYYKLDEHKPRQASLNASRDNYVATADFPDHIKRVLDLYKVHT